MSWVQLLGPIIGITLFCIKLLVHYLNNRTRSLEERVPLEGTIESVMLSAILAIAISISFTQIPTIKDSVGTLASVGRATPELSVLESAVDARKAVNALGDPVVKQIFANYLDQQTNLYKNALSSIPSYSVEISRDGAMKFGENALSAAQVSIDTTSYVAPAQWWTNPDGHAYFLKNLDTLRRKVMIRRIFIYKTDDELHVLQPILAQQKKAGVQVFFVRADELPSNMSRDIIIVDGKLEGELMLDPNTRNFGNVVVTSKPDELSRVQDDWKQIIQFAHQK